MSSCGQRELCEAAWARRRPYLFACNLAPHLPQDLHQSPPYGCIMSNGCSVSSLPMDVDRGDFALEPSSVAVESNVMVLQLLMQAPADVVSAIIRCL
jgi:hypothetical protein